MMSIADQLSASGSPVSDSDLVSALLSGLGPDFNSFVVTITTRSDPVSTSDLFGYALAHEALLSSQHVVPSSADPAVFYAGTKKQRVGPNLSQKFRHLPTPRNQPPLLTRPPYPPTGPVFKNGRGAFTGHNRDLPSLFSGQNPIPVQRSTCQICFKKGHTARECYFRYDQAYSDSLSTPYQAQALFAAPAASSSDRWYLDSGATHHVTADINNLSSFLPYTGTDKLQVGNGMTLSICNIGNCFLSSTNRFLKLSNVLHVPTIQKNLISISRFLQDNDVLIEFYSSFCVIKDRHTKIPLLQAILTNGLYLVTSSPKVFVGERVSADI
jgi:gag-polypeptide of LTR copia-type